MPNPSDGNFSIQLNQTESKALITVYDVAGKLILSDNKENVQSLSYTLNVAPGTYYLQVQLNDKAGVFTILIE